MMFLKQSTASQTRILGPFVDDTDFKAAETGLTIANTDVKLSKNGATSVNKNSGGGTHIVNGVYALTFDATDTDTVGELFVSIVVSGALQVFARFMVLEEAVYDALIAASAPGYLQPTVAGRTLDVSTGGEAGVDWANVGSPTTTVGLSGTTVKTATDVETDTADIQSRLPAALVSGRMSSDAVAISGSTVAADNVEANIGNLDAAVSSRSTVTTAQVNAEVDTALADIHLDHLLAADYDPASKPGVATALLNEIVESDAGVSRFTANALEQAPDTNHVGTGTGLTAIPWNAAWDAEVQSEATDALNAYDPPTNAEMVAAFTEIKGATWSSGSDTLEHIRDKGTDIETDTQNIQSRLPAALVSGRMDSDVGAMQNGVLTGAAIASDAISASKVAADVGAEIADAVCDEALSGHATAGTLGKAISDIEADTNELQVDWADGGRLDVFFDQILADTQEIGLAGAGLTNIPWNVSWDAEVQSEATDALNAYDPPTKAEQDAAFADLKNNLAEGTVGASATTTSIPTSALSPVASTTDQFKGRIVIFDNDTTTAALRGQATDITASTASGTLTVTALTTAPASGDTFRIV